MAKRMSATNKALMEKLLADGESYTDFTQMSDGTLSCVARFMFTWAILSKLTREGYEDRWCYHDRYKAEDALEEWADNYETQLEPAGWHRHPMSGRRIREDGTEYVMR